MNTAQQLLTLIGQRKLTTEEVEQIKVLRRQDIHLVLKNSIITAEHVAHLDWGGRFSIANKYFDRCDDAAKFALLHDKSHPVRAAANLFEPVAPSRATDITQTLMNGQSSIGTLLGDKSFCEVEELVRSTYPKDVLFEAEKFIAGFEGDMTQPGVADLLASLRALIRPV